jgi:hypothetical protein
MTHGRDICPTLTGTMLEVPTVAGRPEILSGEPEPRGKLPVQIPRSMAQVKAQREDLPFDLGCTEAEMTQIEDAIGGDESPPKESR